MSNWNSSQTTPQRLVKMKSRYQKSHDVLDFI